MTERSRRSRRGFLEGLRSHSLSLAALGILATWILLYASSDPSSHAGAFFGNSIADWSGTLFLVIGTKFLYETGSAESRPPHKHFKNPTLDFLYHHSLTLILLVIGLVLFFVFQSKDPTSKWGQVVGNALSESVQMLGIVFLTKRLVERGSKESKR
jgi:hypothetical protein